MLCSPSTLHPGEASLQQLGMKSTGSWVRGWGGGGVGETCKGAFVPSRPLSAEFQPHCCGKETVVVGQTAIVQSQSAAHGVRGTEAMGSKLNLVNSASRFRWEGKACCRHPTQQWPFLFWQDPPPPPPSACCRTKGPGKGCTMPLWVVPGSAMYARFVTATNE